MNMPELIDVVPDGRDLVAQAKELMAYAEVTCRVTRETPADSKIPFLRGLL